MQQHVVFKYHLNELRSQTSYYLYCEYLRSKIMRLICLMHPNFVEQWQQEKIDYLKKREELKRSTLSEINAIFAELKPRLCIEGLLGIPVIEEKCRLLELILAFEPEFDERLGNMLSQCAIPSEQLDDEQSSPEKKVVWVIPSQYQVAFDRLKNLFYAIVEIKGEDLIKNYVESFRDGKEYFEKPDTAAIYQCNECFGLIRADTLRAKGCFYIDGHVNPMCPKCGCSLDVQLECHEVRYIELFDVNKFVPSHFKLIELESDFWTSHAGAWEKLYTIDWGWDIKSRDYFRKDLLYKDAQACERSRQLLELNFARCEVQAVKKSHTKKCNVFNREQIDKALGVVVDKLYTNFNFKEIPKGYGPEAVELELVDDVDLHLKVTWATDVSEICLMHSFQDDEECRCIFFDNLISNPGDFIQLNDPYGDAKKYLREAGIDEILSDIFLDKVNKDGATLKSKHIMLKGETVARLKKIRRFIQRYKSIDWQ